MHFSIARAAKYAIACPGQGIIPKGALYPLRHHQHLFQDTLDAVDAALGQPFCKHLVGESTLPDAWSISTANAQPAIVASTYVLAQLMKRLHGVDLAAHSSVGYLMGHSLGEYSALLLGGVLTLPEAICIVRQRGLLMEEVAKLGVYEMRVLVFKPALYDDIVGIAEKHHVVACLNNATQILVSGTPKDLDAALEKMKQPKKRVLKVAKLPVTIPFHHKLLGAIEPNLRELGSAAMTRSSAKPIVSNFTGLAATEYCYENTVCANSAPVQWQKSMEFLVSNGVDGVINLGPGSAVDAINSRFAVKNVPLKTLEDMEQLNELLA